MSWSGRHATPLSPPLPPERKKVGTGGAAMGSTSVVPVSESSGTETVSACGLNAMAINVYLTGVSPTECGVTPIAEVFFKHATPPPVRARVGGGYQCGSEGGGSRVSFDVVTVD
jgi:hypothetical protein